MCPGGGAVDGETWEFSRFGRLLVIAETDDGREVKVCPTYEEAHAQFSESLKVYLTRFSQ